MSARYRAAGPWWAGRSATPSIAESGREPVLAIGSSQAVLAVRPRHRSGDRGCLHHAFAAGMVRWVQTGRYKVVYTANQPAGQINRSSTSSLRAHTCLLIGHDTP